MLQTVPLAALALLAMPVAAGPTASQASTTTTSLSPWVTVASNGIRKTITPVLSTIDGSATVISGAPHDLTATVFTRTRNGDRMTSTGRSPVATARKADGAGSFLVCRDSDTLFCLPKSGARLQPGKNYYFTWDTSALDANASIMIQGSYLNATTNELASEAFASEKIAASLGYWTLPVNKGFMQGKKPTNISVQMLNLNLPSGASGRIKKGPTVLVAKQPGFHQKRPAIPSGAELYIGLPVIFGFIALCLVGTFVWNKQLRRVTLGNVMSHRRHRYGLGRLRRGRRLLGRRLRREKDEGDAEERVHLMERDVAGDGVQAYYDAPDERDERRKRD